jgi:hypothetical protein
LQPAQDRFEARAVSALGPAAYSGRIDPPDTAMNSLCTLNRLTPAQRSALYDQAKREAVDLRREAMSDAASWLAGHARALWQRAWRGVTARAQPLRPCAG